MVGIEKKFLLKAYKQNIQQICTDSFNIYCT